ncbi:MAG: preprotein translocase subunit SecG [Pseudomonadales bacterium]|nr:preprotein translocase subunit SecG [Pseudomonadales bacterium]
METIILVLSIVIALALVVLIMMQQGKGADMGASFGSGSSQTLFGGQGSGSLLTHVTAILATGFFLTSFGLAILAKNNVDSLSTGIGSPSVQEIPAGLSEPIDLDALEIPDLPGQSLPGAQSKASTNTSQTPDLPVVD